MDFAQDDVPDATEGSLYPICEHIRPGGKRCGSPALRGEHFCFYHHNVRRLVPPVNFMMNLSDPQPERNPNYRYEMPYIEDPESLQIAFSQLIHAVTEGHVTTGTGWLMLSALHGTARNLRLLARAARRHPRIKSARKKPVGSARQSAISGQESARSLG